MMKFTHPAKVAAVPRRAGPYGHTVWHLAAYDSIGRVIAEASDETLSVQQQFEFFSLTLANGGYDLSPEQLQMLQDKLLPTAAGGAARTATTTTTNTTTTAATSTNTAAGAGSAGSGSGVAVSLDAHPGQIRVVNRTARTLYARVSTYTHREGSVDWFSVPVGAEEVWTRSERGGYEGVFFSPDNGASIAGCVYVKNGALVTVRGLSLQRATQCAGHTLSYRPNAAPARTIAVRNCTADTVKVFASRFSSEGSDDWFDVPPNATESWARAGTELVVVTRAADFGDRSKRVGTWALPGELLVIG